jgi:DNA polymerase III subunit delta
MPAASPQQLLARLAKGKPIPAISLIGGDRYLRDLCRKNLIEAYVAEGTRDWGVRRFSAKEDDVAVILGQARTMPMLAPRQVVFAADAEAWDKLGDESRDALVKEISAYLDDPAPYTVLVFEAVALDQRMRLAKVLAEKTLTVSVELVEDPSERARLAAPLALQMAAELGVTIEPGAADAACDLLSGDLTAIHTELEKLAAYAGQRKKITRADVDLLVISSRKYEVWDVADMLAARQPARALEFLDRLLREGEQAVALLGALAWMYRKLLEAQELAPGLQDWQAASRLKMYKDKAALALKQSRRFPREQLTGGLAALYEADNRLKSGVANQRAVMEFLVAQLASPRAA